MRQHNEPVQVTIERYNKNKIKQEQCCLTNVVYMCMSFLWNQRKREEKKRESIELQIKTQNINRKCKKTKENKWKR